MKFIIINGPPGAGKSSLAEALHQALPPLSFLLKFDAQRRFVKDRHEYKLESEGLTYKVCKAIIETCLQEGKNVVFERAVKDPNMLDDFIKLGEKYKAEIFELILWADKETIIKRNTNRGLPSDGLPDSKGVSLETVEKFWTLINKFKNQRSKAHIINVKENNLEQVIDKAKQLIAL